MSLAGASPRNCDGNRGQKIKPSNVLVVDTPQGAVARLLDFGLSSSEGELPIERLAGTPAYLAKERFAGAAHSVSADLYSVGVLAFELLTGQHPFCDESAPEKLISAVLRDAPRLTLLPEELRPLFARVLSAHAAQRPQSASAFAQELSLATSHPIRGEPEAVRDSWLVAAKFTGRQQELSELKHALDQSLCGQGGAWLVRGESGAGKSRLLEELRSTALVEGVLVARGQAAERSGTAYHLFHDVLRIVALHVHLDETEASVLGTILPDLGKLLERSIPSPPELDAPANRLRLLATVRSVIERVPAPLLMLLEDVQWADDESLSLLAQIAAGVKLLPLLVVATYRDGEAPHPPSQLSLLRVQQLQRLDRSGIAQLLESLLGPPSHDPRLIDLLVRETEGNKELNYDDSHESEYFSCG